MSLPVCHQYFRAFLHINHSTLAEIEKDVREGLGSQKDLPPGLQRTREAPMRALIVGWFREYAELHADMMPGGTGDSGLQDTYTLPALTRHVDMSTRSSGTGRR